MSLCFAESLKKYEEENKEPTPSEPDTGTDTDPGTDTNPGDSGNENPDNPGEGGQTPEVPDDTPEPDIYEGMGTIDPDSEWTAVSDLGYKFYDDYSGDDVSVVTEKKRIVIKPDQLNFAQESNSQYVPFQMPRYFDGFDMGKAKIQFYYINAEGKYGLDYAVNVYTSEDRIRFAWLVSGSVTKVPGSIRLEIQAIGKNSNGDYYVWKTYPNEDISIEDALAGGSMIEPDEMWKQNFIDIVDSKVAAAHASAVEASTYAQESKDAAEKAIEEITSTSSEATTTVAATKAEAISAIENTKSEAISAVETTKSAAISAIETAKTEAVDAAATAKKDMETLSGSIGTLVENIYEERAAETIRDKVAAAMGNYYTKAEVDTLIENIDISDQLDDIRNEIDSLDGLASFNVKYDGSKMIFYNGETVMKEIEITSDPTEEWTSEYTATVEEKISTAVSAHAEEAESAYAKKSDVSTLSESVSANESGIATNKSNIAAITKKLLDVEEVIEKVDTAPRLTYEATYDEEYRFTLWEQEGDDESTRTAKSQFVIQGGGGGAGGTTSTLKIEYVTKTPLVVTTNDAAVITYIFSGTDSSGDEVLEGTATWKVGSTVVSTGTIAAGTNSFDITEFLSVGTQKVTLTITDDAGSLVTKKWTVQKIDVRIESTFNDKLANPLGTVSFDYTPYGAVAKTIHIKLDGSEIGNLVTSVSGIPMAFSLPAQTHGAHLLDAYMTADINGNTIESNHIIKDIIWYDENESTPVIGCATQEFTAMQYDTTNIVFSVYDPTTESPEVTLAVDGVVVSTKSLSSNTDTWQYKTSEVGEHTLTITCGETVKTLNATIEELDIEVTPVTAGMVFDFNPTGKSNNDADRLWSDGDISMSVSDNFDWVNGGYQIDDNGDQYFCVKSGTRAVISHNLFSDDPKKTGKEFKVVFKTENVRNRDTSFITCLDDNIGLNMKVESANIYSSNGSLYSPYCEDDIIEFEFNINKNTDIPMVLTYEDGVANRPMLYTSDSSFRQTNPQPITIGSDDCDVLIYRMKAYAASLADRDILSNFIADARNADEMISRYNRNQIYDENGALDPEILAERCPDLRIIMIDAPWFTNDKSNKVDDTNIRMIYKNGDPVLDNWTCTGAKHSGQGTSSNEYGYSGRNLDLIMNGSDTEFTFGDGVTTGKTITLTRNSTPTDYLNIKVNVASSDNENNAQLTMRFNEYQPYMRTARLRDPKIRDTMEFYNCVVFVKERNEDISTHREFTDTAYHK